MASACVHTLYITELLSTSSNSATYYHCCYCYWYCCACDTIGLWVVGITLAYTLTFSLHMKLQGLWISIICGIATTATLCTVALVRTDWRQQARTAVAATVGTAVSSIKSTTSSTSCSSNSSSARSTWPESPDTAPAFGAGSSSNC
jgi:hypothetical protein